MNIAIRQQRPHVDGGPALRWHQDHPGLREPQSGAHPHAGGGETGADCCLLGTSRKHYIVIDWNPSMALETVRMDIARKDVSILERLAPASHTSLSSEPMNLLLPVPCTCRSWPGRDAASHLPRDLGDRFFCPSSLL